MATTAQPTAYVECPDCSQAIPVPIEVRIDVDEDGTQVIFTEPNLADLWAHAWTHTTPETQ